MSKKQRGMPGQQNFQSVNDTDISQNEMTSVNNDGSRHQVKSSTVERKVQDENKCCMCLEIPCGATTLLVLEFLYLIYFIMLLMTVALVYQLASGELIIPSGTMECTHLWDKYGKKVGDKIVPAYTSAEQCRESQSYKSGQEITKKAQKNLDKVGSTPDELYKASEFLYYVGIAMCVCYLPRLYYFCKLCGYQCMGGKTNDTYEDRDGLVWGINALLMSHICTIVSTVAITIFVGVTVTKEKISSITEPDATSTSKWAKVGQILGNQLFAFFIALWWRYDFNKWA